MKKIHTRIVKCPRAMVLRDKGGNPSGGLGDSRQKKREREKEENGLCVSFLLSPIYAAIWKAERARRGRKGERIARREIVMRPRRARAHTGTAVMYYAVVKAREHAFPGSGVWCFVGRRPENERCL